MSKNDLSRINRKCRNCGWEQVYSTYDDAPWFCPRCGNKLVSEWPFGDDDE